MNIEIADRLVELRRSRGYSQEDLAAALGVSRQAVSKWERAESSPDTDNLIALARLYQISLDSLLLHTAAGGCAAAAAPEPEPSEPPPAAPEREEDEASQIFAASAAWDAAEEAAVRQRRSRLRRSLNRFPYPVAITLIYLSLGFAFGWWHPGWMLYLTIPLYYGIANNL